MAGWPQCAVSLCRRAHLSHRSAHANGHGRDRYPGHSGIMMARRPALFALRTLAPLLAFAGSGCSRDEPAPSTQDEQEEAVHATATLAAAIARDPRISETARLLSRTGISQMLDGTGSYTILAPVDDAFGSPPPRNESTGDTAQAIALLRRHILPGYITIADIESA